MSAAGAVVIAAATAELQVEIVGGKYANGVEIGIGWWRQVRYYASGMQIVDDAVQDCNRAIPDGKAAAAGVLSDPLQSRFPF